jgi:threonine/homoserine/homoserine lactone efflux protein
MAGEDLLVQNGNRHALAAVMFMGGAYLAFDAMSTINSSPWTHETFSSPEKMAAGREYVLQAIVVSLAFGTMSSLIGREPWPLIGTATGDAYLAWLYWRAFRRAAAQPTHWTL